MKKVLSDGWQGMKRSKRINTHMFQFLQTSPLDLIREAGLPLILSPREQRRISPSVLKYVTEYAISIFFVVSILFQLT